MYNQGIKLDAPFGGGSGGGFGGNMNGGALGDIFGGIAGLFSNQKNPYEEAKPYFDRIPSEAGRGLQPYAKAGANMLGPLQSQISKLMSDPVGMMRMFGEGFKASPGYQYNVEEATKAGNQSAAAGGMLGTPAAQQELMRTVMGLANQDYDNYMNDVMGLYGQGLNAGGSLAGMGQQSAGNIAQLIAQALAGQGQMAAGSANWENQNNPWAKVGQIGGGLFNLFG